MTVRSSVGLAASVVLLVVGCSAEGATGPRSDRDSGPVGGTDGGGPIPGFDAGPPPPRTDSGPPRPGDRDADGLPDADEEMRGTDPDNDDTDGDGIGDGVEVLAGTDPLDASSTIPPTDFYVVLPYEDPPQMRELDFTARLGRGDVFFLVDTTGSMGIAINNVRSSLSGTIVPAVRDAIADVVMGVGDYRDFPVDPYGSPGDWAYQTRQTMTADVAAVQTALNGLSAGGGADGPESGTEGLYRSASGGSCPAGGFGEACFRAMSHPIIVVVTDNEMHNGPGGRNAYGAGVTARTWAEMTAALIAQEVKIVGANVGTSFFGMSFPGVARPDLEALATATDSRKVDGSLTVYEAPGGEVSTAVVDGIIDLVGNTRQDVTRETRDDPSDTVDARMFIKAVRPVRATRATTFDDTTFYGVAGGTTITFEVTFENDFLPEQTYVQIFQAYIDVLDVASSTVVDTRNVYIVVPAIGGGLI